MQHSTSTPGIASVGGRGCGPQATVRSSVIGPAVLHTPCSSSFPSLQASVGGRGPQATVRSTVIGPAVLHTPCSSSFPSLQASVGGRAPPAAPSKPIALPASVWTTPFALQEVPRLVSHAAGIAYCVGGKYKSYSEGVTSFSAVYDCERSHKISLVSFESKVKAEERFDLLSFCKGNNILPAHFVDNTELVVGPVAVDVLDYFHECSRCFNDKNGRFNDKKRSWWDYISKEFILLIGDILKALIHIYCLKNPKGGKGYYYCGNLKEGSVVKRNASNEVVGAQLAIVKREATNDAEYRQHCVKDIMDLKDLIVDILMIPFPNLNKTEDGLSSQGLPSSLLVFINTLGDCDIRAKWDIVWILDNAYFWTTSEKYALIRKLRSRGHHLNHFGDLANLDNYMMATLPTGHWSSLIPADGPIRDVYNYKKEYYEKQEKSGKNVFLGMVRIFKNVVSHYNDHVPTHKKLGDEVVIGMIDGVFDGACSKLQMALGNYYWMKPGGRSEDTLLDFFLRKNPF